MVAQALKTDGFPFPQVEKESLATTIKLSDVLNAGTRLEASAFSLEARNAVEVLNSGKYPLVSLLSDTGFCKSGFYPGRFKRTYVKPEKGIAFLSSSEIISLSPTTNNYLSIKKTPDLPSLLPEKWDLLLSRSGTIGNIGLATESFVDKALSEHVIRLRSNSPENAGFSAAFLRSKFGRPQLIQGVYGSVVNQIEPEHIERILAPKLSPIQAISIGTKMCVAGEKRDAANNFMLEADRVLHDALSLPRLDTDSGSSITKVKASQWLGRLEASFHNSKAHQAAQNLRGTKVLISLVGAPEVAKEVRAVTKFRKRVYVSTGGIPMLNSKQLFQVDPIGMKRLAKGAHISDLPEIELKENMIAVTCSGTVGKVQIIPKYMDSWTTSQDAIRVIPAHEMNPGYLYAWLASDYGQALVKRHTYGSVVVHIDKVMLASVPIPIPSRKVMNKIGDLVLEANKLRDQAWQNERKAINKLESLIEESAKN